jgi:uncharacterized protein YcbX
MSETHVGTVKALYRYPVKSMAGERLEAVGLGPLGTVGDRVFGLRETAGRVLTAKRTRVLLEYSATRSTDAESDDGQSVTIKTPDGELISTGDPVQASARLSELLERDVTLESPNFSQENFGELDAETIFAGIPIAQALEGKARQLPDDADRYGLAPGTFFDSAHLHLLTTGTLRHLGSLIDDENLDVRRFRPNIFVETVPELAGFIEDEWIDARLHIGNTVEVTDIWPTLRCVMTTVAQSDVPRDLRVLKTIVHEHETSLGAFAAVGRQGTVRVGDLVTLIT